MSRVATRSRSRGGTLTARRSQFSHANRLKAAAVCYDSQAMATLSRLSTFRHALPTKRLMTNSDPAERPVLVLDFGAQYVQLIARRVRERHAFARIVRHDITAERVRELNPLAIILSGGPASVYEPGRPIAIRRSSSWACRSWGSATGCN